MYLLLYNRNETHTCTLCMAACVFSVGSKRRHSDDSCQDGSSSRFGEMPKSEVWSLRDVIFTDHVTNVKVGSVVKLDGNYVAVHYPALSPDELSTANLDNCRLLRKDELVVPTEFTQCMVYISVIIM